MFEKIIVRDKVYKKGELASKLVMLTSDCDFDTLTSFKEKYSDKQYMREIFDERIDQEKLENSLLHKKFEEAGANGTNELFRIMYRVSNNFALYLSENMYLCHLPKVLTIKGQRILPWDCIDSKIYIADTWWETDEEILEDLKNLSFIEFVEKYKAF